jgi:hypothetical protein
MERNLFLIEENSVCDMHLSYSYLISTEIKREWKCGVLGAQKETSRALAY